MKKILETKRLYSRPFEDTKEDLKLVKSLYENKEVMKYFPDEMKYASKAKIKERLKQRVRNQQKYGVSKWAVFLKENNKFIGRAGLTIHNEDKQGNYIEDKSKHTLTLGYALLPQYWGKGYATEISKAICKWAWKKFPWLTKIEAGCDENNLASQRVLEKLGFKFLKKGEFMGLKIKKYILEK